MGCTDAGDDIVGVQNHRLITPNPTEIWSGDGNWVFVCASATDLTQCSVYLQLSAEGGSHHREDTLCNIS